MKLKIFSLLVCLPLCAFITVPALAADTADPKPVYDAYLKIQSTLAADSVAAIDKNASALAQAVRSAPDGVWPESLASNADALARAKDLSAARDAFKAVSQAIIVHWAAHASETQAYRRYYCAMAEAAWLQADGEVANPYMGSAMRHCGTLLGRASSSTANCTRSAAGEAAGCEAHASMNCGAGEAGCCTSTGK